MSLLAPTFYYRKVTDIDLEELRALGVDSLLVDIDNTILPRDTGEMVEELNTWARDAIAAGFSMCLVSNNWHAHVKRVADAIGVQMVPRALKPLPFGFLRGVKLLGTTAKQTAIIGDQLFTDVLGGKLVGMTSVLVQPLSESDLPHTLVLRRLESLVLAGRTPLP